MRIEDYAMIGNLSTAALVSRDGSIDWLCLPRFDSGACFCALLGERQEHGYWQITPRNPAEVRRSYLPGTLVLDTEFSTQDGKVRLRDCMALDGDQADVIRVVEGLEGEVEMVMELSLKTDYGSIVPRFTREAQELKAIAGPDMIHLKSEVKLAGAPTGARSAFKLRAGETRSFSLNWHPSYLAPAQVAGTPQEIIARTVAWWREWSGQSSYRGGYQEAVERSLITLKGLTFAQTGGIVAAPTTSLPERLGGVRNWDYRFCWLRDASFTLYALLSAGYQDEAKAWREWLLRAVAGTPDDLRIMYGVCGERRLTELKLTWLPGYERSKPVRVGNAASHQLQLDVYGEIMGLLYLGRKHLLEEERESWELERDLVHYLERIWCHPDNGLWEVRGPRRHFTHSKVMAWVALDRAIRSIEEFGLEGPLERWRETRSLIHREICQEAYNSRLGSFVQYYGGRELDASLLLLPLVGFIPAQDPRMIGTVRAIESQLTFDGFVCRYSADRPELDGLPPGEGAFLACSFWLVDNLVLQGRRREAIERFERLLSIRNDVGLLAEEYDPESRRFLGNFPQAFSHVALVNSARGLSSCPKVDQ